MSAFKSTVSAPTLKHISVAGTPLNLDQPEVTFPGSSVVVRNPGAGFGGVHYMATVVMHLLEIRNRPLGAQFLGALLATGKRQIVVYGGPNANQCAGASSGYVKLRRAYGDRDRAAFAAELTAAIGRSGKGKPWLVGKLSAQSLPHWDATVTPSPFAAGKDAGVVGMGSAGGASFQKLEDWCACKSLPTVDEMDVLCLVLAPWLAPGSGVGSRIHYDPNKTQVAGVSRPPPVALFHELTHAYYSATGTQLGSEDSASEANGGRLFELMSTGLPPFDGRPFGENQFRAAWPCVLRAVY